MYCPICSAKVASNQKFCRACGFALEKTAQSVSEQHPTEMAQNLQQQKARFERLGVIALSIFGLGVGGFFLYVVVAKVMTLIAQGRILAAVALLGLFVVLACGLLAVFLFAKANDVGAASTERRHLLSEDPPTTAPLGKALPEGHLEGVPSVTDRTTELLFAEREKRR